MSDRMAVLNNGSLQQLGTPAEIYQHPATPIVATLTGRPSTNMIPMEGRVLGARPECIAVHGAGIALPAEIQAIEVIGHEWLVHAVVNGRPVIRRTTQHPTEVPGTHTHWIVPAEHARWFPLESV